MHFGHSAHPIQEGETKNLSCRNKFRIRLFTMKALVLAIVVLTAILQISSATPTGKKRDRRASASDSSNFNKPKSKKSLAQHHGNGLKQCVSEEIALNLTAAWQECFQEFQLYPTFAPSLSTSAPSRRPTSTSGPNPNPSTESGRHHKNHPNHNLKQWKENNCLSACILKKTVFVQTASMEEVRKFASAMNQTVQQTFLDEVDKCFSTKKVDLTTLSMDNKCQSWEGLNKCWQKSFGTACKVFETKVQPTESDSVSSMNENEENAEKPEL